MDSRHKPDPKPENANDPNPKEVIDLTQVIQGEDDDDIIELDTILDPRDRTADASEEEVIPLVDAIPPDEADTTVEELDDEIIDLADVASSLEVDINEPEIPADEEVIDLLHATAVDAPATQVEALPPTDDTETVIDLMDIEVATAVEAGDERQRVLAGKPDTIGTDTTDSTPEAAVEADTETAPADDMKARGEKAITDEPEIPLTDAQVEAALERVIEKIYSEKIEQIMVKTIEKTVNREIEKIKQTLLEDSDDRVD